MQQLNCRCQVVHVCGGDDHKWIRPESSPIPAWSYRFAGLRLHSEQPLVGWLDLVHLRIPPQPLVLLSMTPMLLIALAPP